MDYKGSTLPRQRVADSAKNQTWKEQSVDAILSRSRVGGVKNQRQQVSYNILDSEFDLKDLKYVTDPYKVGEGFPAQLQKINIIAPKINALIGEESIRPHHFLVFRTGEAATKSTIDTQKNILADILIKDIMNTAKEGTDPKELEQEMKEAQQYIKNKYYSPEEQAANNTLKYLQAKLNLPDIFLEGWSDGLTANEEILYAGIVNGEPYAEKVNPLTFSYDQSPDLKGIEEGDWAVRDMEMTSSDIHDRFYDILDDATFLRIESHILGGEVSSINGTSAVQPTGISWREAATFKNKNNDLEEGPRVGTTTVRHCVWRSYVKVGYLTQIDENGEKLTTMVDDSYKKAPEETLEWGWLDQIWEGYRIGKDIYFGVRPMEYQDYSIESPTDMYLPYIGNRFTGNNSKGKSLVEVMKPLQYFYLILFYRLELALARDKGKILNMDITQIPTSMGIDEYKWMHYLTSMGVNFINPHEEGWDIPGREGGKPAQFNQISAVDLTMSNVIAEYINLMDKIESMIGDLTGLTKTRQGQINTNASVGNVQQELEQTSHTTAPLVWKHNKIKGRFLNYLLNVAKFAWRKTDKKFISHVLEGPERIFIELNEDFLYADFDVFVGDPVNEISNLENMKKLYQPAMQNGASFLDIATIMSASSISEVKVKLEEIENKKSAAMEAQGKKEDEAVQAEIGLKQEDNRIKEEDSLRKAETAIKVALINKEDSSNQAAQQAAQDIAAQKVDLQLDKQNKDYDLKNKQLLETERANKIKEAAVTSNTKG